MPMIGEISKCPGGDVIVEWRITGFFSLPQADGMGYFSPDFSFGNEEWLLYIIPDGWSMSDSSGYVDLGIFKHPSNSSIRQEFSLSLKTVKGEKHNEQHGTRLFDKSPEDMYEFNRFLLGSELYTRRSELVPDDVLTIICTMRNTVSTRSAIGKDPEQNSETMCVEASTQTVEEKYKTSAAESSTNPQGKEVLHDFKELFLKKEECDVVLKVKGSEFPAHRLILRARSPVFASTFRYDMKENVTGIVEIGDCDPFSFSDFLCYVYCGDVSIISQENMFGLFTAADKYQVLDLRAKCLEFMKKNLTVDNFCETITLAVRHSETELIKLCTDYFQKNAPKIIVTVKWQTFLTENPTESNELLVKLLVPNSS